VAGFIIFLVTSATNGRSWRYNLLAGPIGFVIVGLLNSV
jgi:hypothetical protein